MDWEWERIGNFGSLCERDRFMAWMRKQIKDGMAEEIDSPAGFDAGDRWFRHISPPARSGVWFRTRTHMGQASGLLMWVTGPHKPEAASVGGLFRYGLFGGDKIVRCLARGRCGPDAERQQYRRFPHFAPR